MVHALRRFHEALVPGALLVDLRPTDERPSVVAGGVSLGELDSRELYRDGCVCDAALEQVVHEGSFVPVAVQRFERIDRFATAASLLAEAAGWPRVRTPEHLSAAVLAGTPPFDLRQWVTLRVLRARA